VRELLLKITNILAKGILIGTVNVCLIYSVVVIAFCWNSKVAQEASDYIPQVVGAAIVRDGEIPQMYSLDTQMRYQGKYIASDKRAFLLPFRNLPIVAVLLLPLSFMSISLGYKVFMLFNLCLLAVCATLLVKGWKLRALTVTWLVSYFPVLASLALGQLDCLIIAVVALIYIALTKNRTYIAGLLTGLLLLKPQFVVAIPFLFLIAKDKRKFGIAATISLVTLAGINSFLYKGAFFHDYLSFLFLTQADKFGTKAAFSFSFYKLYKDLLPTFSIGRLFVINFVGYLAAVTVFYRITKEKLFSERPVTLLTLTLLLTLLFAFHVQYQDLSVLGIPFVLIINDYLKRPDSILNRLNLVMFCVINFVGQESSCGWAYLVVLTAWLYFSPKLKIFSTECYNNSNEPSKSIS
jgi:hypothetical protein